MTTRHQSSRCDRERPWRRGTALAAGLACAVALAIAPGAAQAGLVKTFKPVSKKHHALVFAPKSIKDPASVARARVRLRNRNSGRAHARRLGVARVRRAIERGGRIRVHRGARTRGRLKVRLKLPTSTTPPPGTPPDESIPTTWSRLASFESGLSSGTDYGWRVDDPFAVSRTTEAGASDGSAAARISTNGGNSGCSCPRMTFDGFAHGAGDELWIGGSWRVSQPGKLSWSRLMNLGHFEGSGDPDNWYLALMVRRSGMEFVARRYQTDAGVSVLMPARPIPQNRWFDVDVHLLLSPIDGHALTEVYLDGGLIASSTKPNMLSGGTLHFFNAGLPYFWDGNGNTTVYLDAPRMAESI